MKKIYALGPEGTYGHQAALAALGLLPQQFAENRTVLLSSHRKVFEEVASTKEDSNGLGIVAVENSIGGLVTEVLGSWICPGNLPNLRVVGEVFLPIRHHLMVRPEAKEAEFTKVLSHAQALAQCRNFLDGCDIVAVPVSSTAEGARTVSQSDGSLAAIASDFAAMHYGLEILHSNIADSRNNTTRFHVIGKGPCPEPTGRDRTAILFRVQNSVGSLVQALGAIKSGGTNMSSIHSIPIGVMSEYFFYCELDCHQYDERGAHIVADLQQSTDYVHVLGSYPQAKKPEPE